ncbi:hypothetical protein ScPMuIL_009827 [Solemya velum]
MIGRVLMRKGISESLGIPFSEIQMARTEKGKPYLLNTVPEQNKNFSFNISHQGDYVVIATDPCKKVGIDVMKTGYTTSEASARFFQHNETSIHFFGMEDHKERSKRKGAVENILQTLVSEGVVRQSPGGGDWV